MSQSTNSPYRKRRGTGAMKKLAVLVFALVFLHTYLLLEDTCELILQPIFLMLWLQLLIQDCNRIHHNRKCEDELVIVMFVCQ